MNRGRSRGLSQEMRLGLAFFVLLYGVGGGLIWWFYGAQATLLAVLCITGGLLVFLLLYAIVSLMGWWVKRQDS